MGNNDTYVLKINLNEFNDTDLHSSINKILGDNFHDDDNNEIIIMSKKEYHEYIFNNSGTIINCLNCDDDICIICHNQIKNKKKFKLNMCNHIFHYKCIKKWFKILSEQKNLLHHCPICRASNEHIIDI